MHYRAIAISFLSFLFCCTHADTTAASDPAAASALQAQSAEPEPAASPAPASPQPTSPCGPFVPPTCDPPCAPGQRCDLTDACTEHDCVCEVSGEWICTAQCVAPRCVP